MMPSLALMLRAVDDWHILVWNNFWAPFIQIFFFSSDLFAVFFSSQGCVSKKIHYDIHFAYFVVFMGMVMLSL